MPLLDVSDILNDPAFADTFTVIRPQVTIDNHGRGSANPAQIPQSGVVTAKSGINLNRTPEGQIVYGSITIHTQFRLVEGDMLYWNGSRYTVAGVDDYSRYGGGFIAASCELLPLNRSAGP
ncbi:hypothetical protein [Labrys neptuniae]